jgi:hypothetical protein
MTETVLLAGTRKGLFIGRSDVGRVAHRHSPLPGD